MGRQLCQYLERRQLLAAGPYVEEAGLVVMEAEHADTRSAAAGRSWTDVTAPAGFAGTGAVVAAPDGGLQLDGAQAGTGPSLGFRVRFAAAGTYRVWLRGSFADGAGNSAHAGLNGKVASSADRISAFRNEPWSWVNSTMDGPVATLSVPSAGEHMVNVWMREDGFRLDRLLLARSSTYKPAGTGPAESRRATDASPPTAPEQDLPWNITRLREVGERAVFSPDGRRLVYMHKSFGRAAEIDLATGQERVLTAHFPNVGFNRVHYLPNGDFILVGARRFVDLSTALNKEQELWVLKADLSGPAIPLGQKAWENVAIDLSGRATGRNTIAWANNKHQYPERFEDSTTALYTGDIVYDPQTGAPSLVNRREVLRQLRACDPQDFRRGGAELIYNNYGGQYDVRGLDLAMGTSVSYRSVAGEYNEAEGIFPDGQHQLVESGRDKGANRHLNQYLDIWKLRLEPKSNDFHRITRFGDFAGYKSSNPTVSPDGRYTAFQEAKIGDRVGVGRGIFFMDMQAPAGDARPLDDGFAALDSAWTVATSSPDGTRVSVTPAGGRLVFSKSADGSAATTSITRTISTDALKDVSLRLTALQSATAWEGGDRLKIEVDTGYGFVRLLTDGEQFRGVDNATGDGTAGADGRTTPTATDWLELPRSAADKQAVRVRITCTFSEAAEKFLLDRIEVAGTATGGATSRATPPASSVRIVQLFQAIKDIDHDAGRDVSGEVDDLIGMKRA